MEQISFTPPTLEALNELLPSYQFTDFIAKGGMGAVYRATQTSLDRDVAIKVLPPELSTDPEFHASFRTEARAMARLNHPNLVGIYDSGEMDGMLYIVMEYVAGKSLYHSCWNKQIDPDEVKRIITAICEGLHHAHENGIIHRDIKPANILLTPKVEPKIGDFGLAQAVGSKYEGIVMGTPGYAAPEIISHPEKMDRRSDIFAVGVMLYEMLVGKLPTPGSLPSQACKCPPGFDTIYQKATHPNAAMRYTDAKKLSEALRSLIIAQNSTRRLQGNPPRGVANTTARARPVSATKPVARPISAPKPVARPTAPARPMARPMSVAEALAPQVIPEPVEYEVVAPPAITEPEIAPPSPAPEVLPPEEVALQDLDVVAEPLDVPTLDDQNPVSKWPLVRNLTIICILLAAFVFAYLYHNNQKNNNQQQEESAR